MRKIFGRINTKLLLGGSLMGLCFLMALCAPWLTSFDPGEMNWTMELQKGVVGHPLGFDDFGRDVWSRILYGARISLGVAVATVLLSLSLGTVLGMTAGFLGGKVDELFIFVSDLFMSFPSILLIIAIAAFVPPSVANVIFVLSFVGWVGYARILRSQVLELKEREFILASKAMGAGIFRILFRHILPNALGPLMVVASFGVAGVVLAESTLSFLGLGLPASEATWGAMLNTGVRYLLIAPHMALFSGLAIMITVLGFNFIGDGLRDFVED